MECEISASHHCFSKDMKKYNNIHMPQSRTNSSKIFWFFGAGRKLGRIQLCWMLCAFHTAGHNCCYQCRCLVPPTAGTTINYINQCNELFLVVWEFKYDSQKESYGLCNRISKPVFYTLYWSFRIVGAFSAILNNPKRLCRNCAWWTPLKNCS